MKAHTLIELLVTLAILVILTGGILGVMNAANLSWNSNLGMLDLQQAARRAMDGMTRETRQSRPAGIIVSNSATRLDFNIPNVDSAISYYIENNQIIREHPAGVKKILANNIEQINFCCSGGADCADCVNSKILKINLQASKVFKNAAILFSLNEQVKLRNE